MVAVWSALHFGVIKASIQPLNQRAQLKLKLTIVYSRFKIGY